MVNNNPKKRSKKKTTKNVSKKTTKKKVAKESVDEMNKVNPNVIVVVSIIVLLAILAALIFIPDYLDSRRKEAANYNNFHFEQYDDGLWGVNVEVNTIPYLILMHYHPEDLTSVIIEQKAVDTINALATQVAVSGKGHLYLTMDPTAPAGLAIAGVELAKVLGEKFGIYNIPTSAAFSKPKEGFGTNIPIITCQDAVDDVFVVYLREDDNDYVGVPNGFEQCIVLQGTNASQIIKSADAFVYALFNILPAR